MMMMMIMMHNTVAI